MSTYETPDGEAFSGAEVFGRLKSGTWDLVTETEEPEGFVVRADGDLLELTLVEGPKGPVDPERPYGGRR